MTFRTALLIVLSTLLAAPLAAETRSGLEFGFPSGIGIDNVNPSEVDGYAISWTRRNDEGRGLRLGLTLGFRAEDGSAVFAQDDESVDRRNEQDVLNVALRLQKLYVSQPRRGVALLLGVGPMVGYSSTDLWDYSSSTQRHIDASGLTAGLAWDLGVEWEAASQVSVGARYRWTLAYERSERSTTYEREGSPTQVETTDSDAVSLQDGGTADLLVTVWF